jgi:hypothetical protein
MSFSWPTALYMDQDFTVAEPIQIPEPSSPVPAQPDSWLFTQDYMQLLANWQPGVFNSLHPDFSSLNGSYSGPDFFLVAEGPRRDIDGGVVKWQRTYAAKPSQHNEPESFAYNFIGYVGLWSLASTFFPTLALQSSPLTLVTSGRSRFNRAVNSRVQHDYFIVGGTAAWSSGTTYAVGDGVVSSGIYYVCTAAVGPTATAPAADPGHWAKAATPDYASASLIPSITAQVYTAGVGGTYYTDYINDALSGPFTIVASVPSLTTYLGWVAGKTEIVAEDSQLHRWQGNIFLRQTRYVIAI